MRRMQAHKRRLREILHSSHKMGATEKVEFPSELATVNDPGRKDEQGSRQRSYWEKVRTACFPGRQREDWQRLGS